MCVNCDWEELLEEIENMQGDERFEFADDTLCGIYDWVTENEDATEKQKEAVGNIRASVEI